MTDKPVLNQDQKAAADAFFNFLLSDAKIFVLSGSAGTGKTFLMNHLHKSTMQLYEDSCKLLGIPQTYTTLAFTATTNKAAEVLENSLGVPVQTLHSYMGLKVKENYKTGKTEIEKTNNYMTRRNVVLFVDESSMIDQTLYNLVMETFLDCKIVFVGDHAQMAPVNEEMSVIYKNVDPANFAFLNTPVRNANSPALMELCAQLRETVETGIFNPIQEVPGSIEYLNDAQMQDKLNEVFQNDLNPSCRILCYTNSRVQDFNNYIREIRSQPPEPQPGDRLVVASPYQVGRINLSVERVVSVVSVHPEKMESLGEFDGRPLNAYPIELTTNLNTYDSFTVRIPEEPQRFKAAVKYLMSRKRFFDGYALKNACADLRDVSACTVYKSQGSTYEQVFVDIGNIGTSYDAKQVARMLFVAMSRATTKVYLFGQLPGRYIRSQAT